MRWWLISGLFLLCMACAIGEPGDSSMVYVDAAADVFVYDASIGPEQPIAGALETVCREGTNERGLATCMWYGGQMTVREMERRRQEQHTITVTVRAEGFHTFTRVMAYQNTPAFAIGLWPGEVPHLPEATPPEGELVVNGDFSAGLEGWEVVRSATCTTCTMEVQSSGYGHPTALTWAGFLREGERAGRAVWAQQTLRRDVSRCRHLTLSLDVRVQRQSPYQSPAWRKDITTGEYPAKLRLIFTDEAGERFERTHGFSHTRREWEELENYIIVSKGEWTHFEVDVLSPEHWVDAHGEPLPRPATLEAVYVGGNGWEFDAAVTDLHLGGCDAPVLATLTPPPTPIPSPMPDVLIPPDQLLFLEMAASADGKLVEGEPVRVHVAPFAYTLEDGVLRSDEPIFASSRLLLGESVVLSGAAGSGAYRHIYESSILPVERSIGGTYVPLELTARIEAVEPDGTVHVVLNGESVVLGPGQRWMRSELQVVETERSTIEYTSRITFQNHGLLARDNVIGLMPTPTPAATEEQ